MQKIFTGEVIVSKDNSFRDQHQRDVTLWQLVVAKNEKLMETFHVSSLDKELFDQAKSLEVGDKVVITCEVGSVFQNVIKWKPVKIEFSDEE